MARPQGGQETPLYVRADRRLSVKRPKRRGPHRTGPPHRSTSSLSFGCWQTRNRRLCICYTCISPKHFKDPPSAEAGVAGSTGHDILTAPWKGTRHGPGGSKTRDTEDTSRHLGVVRAGRTEAGAEAALLWAVLSSPWCPSLTRSPVACPRTAGGGDDGA